MKKTYMYILLLTVAVIIGGCTPAKVVIPRIFWPPAPDIPRIEYIGRYASVLHLNETTTASAMITNFLGSNEDAIHLKKPMSIVSNSSGRVYVSDADAGCVYIFDFNARTVSQFGGQAYSENLKAVNGVALDTSGNVYAMDNTSRKVFVTDPNNVPIKVIDISASNITRPGRFKIDSNRKRIIVPDLKGDKIVITDIDGKLITAFGKKGAGDGEFNQPQAVALEKNGNILVCDSLNTRIQRFTPDGVFIDKFGRRGDGMGDLALPKDLATDSQGNIYVTDGKNHNISIYSQKGEVLMTFGNLQSQAPDTDIVGAGGFFIPQGIDIDRNDRIFVADQMNRRFQVFQFMNERYISQYPVIKDGGTPLPVK